MTEERLKEILDRLERIDHKEYSGGFEIADSSTFNEMARCFEERKELYNEVFRLREIIDDIKEYVNYLVIFNQTINGKFSETQWGEDILSLLKENNGNN